MEDFVASATHMAGSGYTAVVAFHSLVAGVAQAKQTASVSSLEEFWTFIAVIYAAVLVPVIGFFVYSIARDPLTGQDKSESDGEPTQATVVVADGGSGSEEVGSEGEDDAEEEDDLLDFTQTDYAVQISQSEPPTQETDGAKSKEPSVPRAITQLPLKTVEDLTAKLVRFMLYKGGLKLPIKFADIGKVVFPTYKSVSRYFFHKAKKQLEDVFGFRVVQVEDNSTKEVYLVLNSASSQEHLQLLNKTDKAASRGLLMTVLGLLWCAPARRLSEGDEVKPVPTMEPTVASDAPVGSKRKRSGEPQWARAFPHVEGNWPSHVRISIPVNQQMRELARAVIERVHELVGGSVALVPFEGLEPGDDTPPAATEGETELHLSLSRPFVLTFTQIDSFVDALRAALKWRQRCVTLVHNYPHWARPDLTAVIMHVPMIWPQLSGDAAPSACVGE
ncbi:hypothetical protein BBJ28_00017376 [Nothophytophthora sp. Chile5]|nr:hypothetical protein BBJ28_00017376 [Nothophytophthora sp. Chile5]